LIPIGIFDVVAFDKLNDYVGLALMNTNALVRSGGDNCRAGIVMLREMPDDIALKQNGFSGAILVAAKDELSFASSEQKVGLYRALCDGLRIDVFPQIIIGEKVYEFVF
jgi:hypothetical protein